MKTPTLSDEKRAEYRVNEWLRGYKFNMRLDIAVPGLPNAKAFDNSHNELEAARESLKQIRRARNPRAAVATNRMIEQPASS